MRSSILRIASVARPHLSCSSMTWLDHIGSHWFSPDRLHFPPNLVSELRKATSSTICVYVSQIRPL